MPKKHKVIESVILIFVLLTAAVGLYYMYAASTGKAFITAPTITVKQTTLEFCCCAPTAREDHPFTVFGKITKDATPEQKTASCTKICGEHGSASHPTKLLKVGRCGGL
jgi:hypothetical protein